MRKIIILILMFFVGVAFAQSPTVKDLKLTNNVRFLTYGDTLFRIKSYNDTLIVNNDTICGMSLNTSPFIFGDSMPSAILSGGNSVNSALGAVSAGIQDTILSTSVGAFTAGFGNYSRNEYNILLGYNNKDNQAVAFTRSSILIGKSNTRANVGNVNSIAIGENNTVGGGNYPSIAIGRAINSTLTSIGLGGTLTNGDLSINIGFNNNTATSGISLGYNQGTNGINAICLGYSSNARANSVSLGVGITHSGGSYSNHIGSTITNSGANSNLLGVNLSNTGTNANLFGVTITNSGTYSTVLGYRTKNVHHNAIVMGYDSITTENNLIVNTILRANVYDTVTVNLTNAGGEGVSIPTNYICMFNVDIVAVDTSDLSRSISKNVTGRIVNDNGTTTITAINVASSSTATATVGATIVADDVNDKLQVQVTNESLKYFRYVANLRLTFIKIK